MLWLTENVWIRKLSVFWDEIMCMEYGYIFVIYMYLQICFVSIWWFSSFIIVLASQHYSLVL